MKIYATLFASVAALATAGHSTAFADKLEDVVKSGTLVCGVITGAKPFGFQDTATRELVGYDIDFCKGVAGKMGLQARVTPVSVEGRIPELRQGSIDVLVAALGYTKERAEQIDYSDAYYVSRQIVIVDEGSGIQKLDGLSGKKISTAKGSSSEQYLRQSVPGVELMSYQDIPSAFLAFVQNKVDGMALTDVAALQFKEKSPKKFEIVPDPLKIEPWGLGIAKGETALTAKVNDSLKALETSGEADSIYKKWFGAAGITRTFTIAPVTKYLAH
ncbi:transporter substrate-binding domain-containing protein [Rhizobium leguminosarum]|uniref:transporter substrate-binding domain-containing protein n=1 Tax=Rhizobium leguminosarum TaxID=384 RepID=UPI000FEC52BC|nr:transporter substrate-binding domain-containing protein [Rhizobium leguminosarum]RWX35219.1 transporter substrate-binding domain-containing protein [Rhizobium leguminosarum]